MKKLIITTMALALMAGPAFAFGGSDSSKNRIRIGDTTGTITNGGAYSATYGSANVGATVAITTINDDVHAPKFRHGIPTASEFSYTGVSNTAIGANTYYAEQFGGNVEINVPADGAVDDSPSPNEWGWGDFLR